MEQIVVPTEHKIKVKANLLYLTVTTNLVQFYQVSHIHLSLDDNIPNTIFELK